MLLIIHQKNLEVIFIDIVKRIVKCKRKNKWVKLYIIPTDEYISHEGKFKTVLEFTYTNFELFFIYYFLINYS